MKIRIRPEVHIIRETVQPKQLCPKCLGQGVVAIPPGHPVNLPFTSNQTTWVCDLCNGNKII
jgi:hypothetical protein